MALQSKVNTAIAPAIAGMLASVDEAHFTAVTLKSKTAITVGNFVFFAEDGDANDYVVQVHGTKPVRGLAIWNRVFNNAGLTASMSAPAYSDLTIATEGAFWVKADNQSTPPKVGDKVFAMDADGSIQTHASTVSSAQPTNFIVTYVESKSDNKSMIVISNLIAQGDAAGA